MALTEKKQGVSLDMRVFHGNDGKQYLVFRTKKGSFHVFTEVQSKEAAEKCGAVRRHGKNVRSMWRELWK